MTVTLQSRADFTLDTARRVAWEGEAVVLGQTALDAMAAGRARLAAILAHDPEVTIYGVTTGAGQLAKRKLKPEERKGWAKMSPVGAASSWGDLLPDRIVRLIVLARLANFVEGHAAVSPEIARGVAAMLDGGPMPALPAKGQGGAGEILSLSHLFIDLVERIEPEEKDVMCLVNGSPSATGLVADAALAAAARLEVACDVLALSFEGFNAPLGHLDAALEAYWNNPHDRWALAALRGRIAGGHGGERRSYQAPVSFRIAPRMVGQARRAAVLAEEVAAESLQAVTDNPVWIDAVDDDHPHGRFVSTGGYHNPHAVLAMDALTAAYANLCVIAERHGAKLLDGNVSLLPDQLIDPESPEGVRRGYMGCLPMAQTGYEEEARLYAQATLLPGSESGGFGQNDVASPVFLAWTKQQRAGECLDMALASLAPIALRALDVTRRPVPEPLAHLAATMRDAIPDLAGRQPFGPAVDVIAQALRARIYP
jgi:histidine ammonia-lyase